jgi:hypothetical protein
MAFCINCGTKLEDGARFCLNCGTKCAEDAAPQVYQQTAPMQAQYYQQPAQPPQQQQQQMYQQGAPVSQEPPIVFGASLIRSGVDKLLGRTTQLIISDISIVETGEKFEIFFDDITDIIPWEQKSSGITIAEFITIKVKDINKYPKFSGKAGALNKLFYDGAPIILSLNQYKTKTKELLPILAEKWQKRMERAI